MLKRLMESVIWAQGLRKKLEPGKQRHPYQANHSLRKWFKTRCEIAGMKPIKIEPLLSHSVGVSAATHIIVLLKAIFSKTILEQWLTETTERSGRKE